ncbi:hypothetical protein W97_04766 [Coniosporium apollinis CBS 100218]|uniref:Uncharacterized protein n=1 Tax=Coniosporium apollinis (strain CBS 100218) TaxID=1168221 RepID=R7YUK5_CONA1|nr:uncharacterized protein W97_04766 [Coniosporium apollinis CBS 100218]EON65528.1 hypothetical protein W97_04766 [Coniosporium apollinis CBS 100218]
MSAAIAATAKALEEKARESAPASAYTTNPMPSKSPERSLIKGAQHKRMQSLQTSSVRDLRSFLDGARSPERSPERQSRVGTPTFSRENDKDYLSASPERSPTRMGTPTPGGRDLLKDTPSLRPTSRPLHKAILGENTPPSATMLALQTMPVPADLDTPLLNITNSSTPRPSQAADMLSTQIQSLTTIATSLQREMAQLSRRSKDNAGDLISLKEATNSRDEDIRKSLKELLSSVQNSLATHGLPPPGLTRSVSFDPITTPPNKSFTLPRIPTPSSLMFDDLRIGSPSPYSVEGAASVAMLEKIIREMVTKEGQERLLSTLNTLFDKASKESSDTAKKVGELMEFVKNKPNSQALITTGPTGSGPPQLGLEYSNPEAGILTRTTLDMGPSLAMPSTGDSGGGKAYSSPKAADFVSADMLKLLKKIKDSVAESGGQTAEVKALVRDLRGEVLGMGREIARKIDEQHRSREPHLALEEGPKKVNLENIVRDGLAELKDHMDRVMKERRRQSSSSVISRTTVDSQQVYDVVKHALAERGLDQVTALSPQAAALSKEEILGAVKEAYEAYTPDVEVQQLGLERDEILQCLKEGLEGYRSIDASREPGISRDEIMDTIHEAIQHVTLPSPANEFQELKEEVLLAVREALENHKATVMPAPARRHDDLTREAVVDAVKQGLATHGPNAVRELEISRDDLFHALKASLADSPLGTYSEQVMNRLHGLVEDMRSEFKAYSSANGRDTEQVLDAVKDGLESLRAEIESYVDRAQDVTGKDEIIDTVKGGLEQLRSDVEGYVAIGPQGDSVLSRTEMLAYIRSEFEHLHETIGGSVTAPAKDKEEIICALNEGFEAMKLQSGTRDLDDDDEMMEAMKEEFELLKTDILGESTSNKDQLLEAIHAGLDRLHARLDGREDRRPESNEEILIGLKEEMVHLRETLATTLIKSGASNDSDEIVDRVREFIDGLRSHLSSEQKAATEENMAAVRGELKHLRETMGTALVRSGESDDKGEILEALRSGFEEMLPQLKQAEGRGATDETLVNIREELERLRTTIAASIVSNAPRNDTEEILDTVRLGLDDLRSHLERKIENPDKHISATGEVIDALNEGLDCLRADVSKIVNKPVDMTVSYEILDTLKDGLAGLRADIELLKADKESEAGSTRDAPTGNEIVLADSEATTPRKAPAKSTTSEEIAPDALRRKDLEKMEVLLAKLQIKVEAMDSNIQNPIPAPPAAVIPLVPAPGVALQSDLAGIEELLKDLQGMVALVAERDGSGPSDAAKKEDTDAIETLLRNTSAKIDDMILTGLDDAVTKEKLEAVEAAMKSASEAIEGLGPRLDENATKGDVAVVEVLVQDLKTAIEELKDVKKPSEDVDEEAEKAEKVTKTDFDIVALLCNDIKTKVESMTFPEAEALPTKADVEQLTGLIHDFRESHDRLRDSYETDIAVTAKAFDDRKKEAEDLILGIADMKTFIEEVKEELKTQVTEGGSNVEALKDAVKGLEETISSRFNIDADVKELMEIVTREFERAQGSIEGLITENGERSAVNLEKHDEVKTAVVSEISAKLDERFEIIAARYDDAVLAADAQVKAMEEKSAQQEELLTSTRAMAEELKLTLDTLGASVVMFGESFKEASEKMSGDSQIVFDRMEHTAAKLEEHHTLNKTEHQDTRHEIAKALTALDGLQGEIIENHPRFSIMLQEIQALVKQHYEHAQKSDEAAKAQAALAAKEAQNRAEELEEIKNSFHASVIGLPALLPPPPPPAPEPERYDDSHVQDKLNKLIEHAADSEKSITQLDRLDQIHKQVLATAAEVSDFVAKQTQFITEGHESKEREAEEVALLLERRLAQKDQLESDITSLNHEKESLSTVVESLRAEKDALAAHKAGLAADVSALKTALDIRREELAIMESKADTLERRILEQIMDHSRAMMMARSARTVPTTHPKPAQPSRMASTTPQKPATTTASPVPSAAATALTLALKARPPVRRNNGAPINPASRRILSLNQITHNVPTGSAAFVGAPNTGLKRSHSVKTAAFPRKSSWGGRRSSGMGLDKENEVLSEESEGEEFVESRHGGDGELHTLSEAGTERRHSYATAVTGTESALTYGTGSYLTETPSTDRRTSFGAGESERTYGTGSYLTGTESERRTSYGSTVRSTLGGTVIDEEGEEEGENTEVEQDQEEGDVGEADGPSAEEIREEIAAAKRGMVLYAPPSDSGLGSDLPTGRLSGGQTDYFRRVAEEGSQVG